MGKRNHSEVESEPCDSAKSSLQSGDILTDITGKRWKLGRTVGGGGFGEIYLASDSLKGAVKTDTPFVAKIEAHASGPLFVELNCYLRIAKPEMIDAWKRENKVNLLGMPQYVAYGSHLHNGGRFRFLILPKFDKDLEKVLEEKQSLNIKSVMTIALQIIDVLDYIHSRGYIHSDIKATNILLSSRLVAQEVQRRELRPKRLVRSPRLFRTTRNLRARKQVNYFDGIDDFEELVGFCVKKRVANQVYLLDYGLAARFLKRNGEHKAFEVDGRRAHAGTIMFCSSDAHLGVSSRRSDLESLGYNMVYWLTGGLPWSRDVDEPNLVARAKSKALENVDEFLTLCFNGTYPDFLFDYFNYIQIIRFKDKPNYSYCKDLFKETIRKEGFQLDNSFDFDKSNSWKSVQKPRRKFPKENRKMPKLVHRFSRPPLQSRNNIPILRKKIKNMIKWSQILKDPEKIIKRNKKIKKHVEQVECPNIADLRLETLNPTQAMREVYQNFKEGCDESPTWGGNGGYANFIEGYTPAMMQILDSRRKRIEMETEKVAVVLINKCESKKKRKWTKKKPVGSPPQTRRSKSSTVIKNDNLAKSKSRSGSIKRTYTLRG